MTDPASKEDQSMSKQLAKSWTSFARTGNPNYDGNDAWPRYSLNNDVMRLFNPGAKTEIRNLNRDRVNYQMETIKQMYGVSSQDN